MTDLELIHPPTDPTFTPGWFAAHRHLYPDDWDEIAHRIKTRAGWECEACGTPHGPPPHILTVDHVVDHDPGNVADANLAALCQRCHLRRQGIRPAPTSKEDALAALRRRVEWEKAQGSLFE